MVRPRGRGVRTAGWSGAVQDGGWPAPGRSFGMGGVADLVLGCWSHVRRKEQKELPSAKGFGGPEHLADQNASCVPSLFYRHRGLDGCSSQLQSLRGKYCWKFYSIGQGRSIGWVDGLNKTELTQESQGYNNEYSIISHCRNPWYICARTIASDTAGA